MDNVYIVEHDHNIDDVCHMKILPYEFTKTKVHQKNMSMKQVPPQTSLLCSETGIYRGIQFFFFFLFQNINCGHLLEVPIINVLSKNVKKKYIYFFPMKFQFLQLIKKNTLYIAWACFEM